MTEQEMLQAALDVGFADAAFIDTERIPFEPSFRPLCAENLCGQYGVNYSCPEVCGTVEEMRGRILRYRRALVLQTMWNIDDPLDGSQTKPAKAKHNRMTRQVMDRCGGALMVGASGCSLCVPCAMGAGEPCRFPDQRWSCMSAYCIFVQEMTAACGMDYDAEGLLSFFSLCCFDPRP